MSVPFSKLIRMVYPSLEGRPAVALFRAYVDESTDNAEKFFVVGGFVGNVDVWAGLEDKWLAALPSFVKYFHATDCFSGNEQFQGMEHKDREKLVNDLVELIVTRNLYLIAYGIPILGYKKFAKRPKINEFLGNRYLAPFSGSVELACQYARSPSDPFPTVDTDRICIFFIEDTEYSDGVKRLLREMKTDHHLWWRNSIGPETFGSKDGAKSDAIPLLQIADLGAFLAAKKLGNSPEGRVPWKQFYERIEKVNHILGVHRITEEELDKFYAIHLEEKARRNTALQKKEK